jgi:hypothetical protein
MTPVKSSVKRQQNLKIYTKPTLKKGPTLAHSAIPCISDCKVPD